MHNNVKQLWGFHDIVERKFTTRCTMEKQIYHRCTILFSVCRTTVITIYSYFSLVSISIEFQDWWCINFRVAAVKIEKGVLGGVTGALELKNFIQLERLYSYQFYWWADQLTWFLYHKIKLELVVVEVSGLRWNICCHWQPFLPERQACASVLW